MAQIRVAEEGVIQAPPTDVYRFIADYVQHHPNYLPPELSDLKVVRGGVGAGTEITFQSKVSGQIRHFHARIDEPEPGTILTETDLESTLVTTYRFTTDKQGCRVRIETTWESTGIKATIERWMAPRLLRRIYADELRRLDRYAQEQLAHV